jgi:hypothetical protein
VVEKKPRIRSDSEKKWVRIRDGISEEESRGEQRRAEESRDETRRDKKGRIS